MLQPSLLYGGADPLDLMRTPLMVADASPVDIDYATDPLVIAALEVEAVSLAGHSISQMGIVVDGVFFAADVVLPESNIEKCRIPYLYSVTDHLIALDRGTAITASAIVPGHGPILESIRDLRNHNRTVILPTADLVLDYCWQTRTGGEIMSHVLDGRGANVSDAPG